LTETVLLSVPPLIFLIPKFLVVVVYLFPIFVVVVGFLVVVFALVAVFLLTTGFARVAGRFFGQTQSFRFAGMFFFFFNLFQY
jgi:hypothetical protein